MPSNVSHNIDDFESLLITLQNTLGIVVPDEQRNSLIARITPLLTTYKLDSLSSLANILGDSQSEDIRAVVFDVVSQTQMNWNLSGEIKDVLNNYIFSQLPEDARVWIVGCGQGQFAYAVVMEMEEYLHKNNEAKNVQFIATDISTTDIKHAESGIYNKQQMAGLSEEYKKLFTSFNDKTGESQIKEKIRQKISFSECDLTEDFQSLGQMDLIVCPEALAYFSNDIKNATLRQCSDLLKPGGILLTGSNHILMSSIGNLERVEHSAGVFYRQKN
ncbi:MAG: methyltransferase [Gammaproteobacteria bacterium]|nr:methyltransferase [Gammaproteobacteria bacterium]